jgi:acyl carrier protein
MSADTLVRSAADLARFDNFVAFLSDELGCPMEMQNPDTLLVEGLGWDSLAFFELLGLFDRCGLDPPEELVGSLRTLGDVHHYFQHLSQSAGEAPKRAPLASTLMLEPPAQHDFDYLYQLHSNGDQLVRYRLRGLTPSPDAFHRLLWDGVIAQFVVRTASGSTLGLVSCLGADFRNRFAHVAVVGDPRWRNSGLVIAGAWQFFGYLFSTFDLRKLYGEVLESNFASVATGIDRLFEIEGRLTAHEYLDGVYEDVLVLALDRDRWQEQEQRLKWRPSNEPLRWT